jgi:hypothetical protein
MIQRDRYGRLVEVGVRHYAVLGLALFVGCALIGALWGLGGG